MSKSKKLSYFILFIVLFVFNMILTQFEVNFLFRIVLGALLCVPVMDFIEKK